MKKRKFATIALVAAMATSMLGVTAYADYDEDVIQPAVEMSITADTEPSNNISADTVLNEDILDEVIDESNLPDTIDDAPVVTTVAGGETNITIDAAVADTSLNNSTSSNASAGETISNTPKTGVAEDIAMGVAAVIACASLAVVGATKDKIK